MKEDTRVVEEGVDAGPWQYGEEPKQGKRSDLEEVKALIDGGASVESIADSHFSDWCRYRQSFKEYSLMRSKKRSWQTTVTVYWGPSGTGKTRRAAYEAGPNAYWLNNTGGNVLWWDGYDGQEVVVIDEFYGWIKYTDMLRIIDRYPYAVQVMRPALLMSMLRSVIVLIGWTLQVRGASVNFVAKHVIITSNTHPNAWWQQGLRAMERRLEPPIGSVMEMLTGVWEPAASSVPLPPSSVPLPIAVRAATPTLSMIDCGSSTRPAISSVSLGGGPSGSGGSASERDAVMMDASASMFRMASPTTGTMRSTFPPSLSLSATLLETRQRRTPSPPSVLTFAVMHASEMEFASGCEWSWQQDNLY